MRTEGRLYGTGFANRAWYFDYLHGYSSPGSGDVAHLSDSAGDDRFVGRPTYSKLTGDDFFYRAKGFDEVYASAGEGNDEAELYDSDSDDLLEAGTDWARLSANSDDYDFLYEVLAFNAVTAKATTGTDTKDVPDGLAFLTLEGGWQDAT